MLNVKPFSGNEIRDSEVYANRRQLCFQAPMHSNYEEFCLLGYDAV
jgi:hypothetical protein